MYQWRKGLAVWRVGSHLYISVPFTWLVEEAQKLANEWSMGEVSMGGPGLMKPTAVEGFEPILFHNPCATFTTRGCPNSCPFCAVSLLEPDFYEVPGFKPAPLICDNNLLAATKKHIRRVVDWEKVFPFVDFNQGLEAKRFTPDVADMLGELRCKVRFAFDDPSNEGVVKDAIDLCRARATNNIGVYCLIGYDDSPDDAQARLELVRSWGIRPNPMRYQPLRASRKNEHLAPGWTEIEMRRMMHYYSRLRWYEHIPFNEFVWIGSSTEKEDNGMEIEDSSEAPRVDILHPRLFD